MKKMPLSEAIYIYTLKYEDNDNHCPNINVSTSTATYRFKGNNKKKTKTKSICIFECVKFKYFSRLMLNSMSRIILHRNLHFN